MGTSSWREAVQGYVRPPVIAVFFLGISSGFPLTLILATLSLWLSREGVSKADVGLFALTQLPYTIKFLWAPLLDRLPLPVLTRLAGQRRSWLFLAQATLFAALLFLGASDPQSDLPMMALAAVCVAFASATQDIAIDAYRIEILKPEDQGYGAAGYVFGYRAGNLIAGIGTISLVALVDWHTAYHITAFALLFGAAAALVMGEPARHDDASADALEDRVRQRLDGREPTAAGRLGAWLFVALIGPFLEFLRRPYALLILAFVFVYKWGDAMGQVMLAPLIVDLGFTNAEYIWANKTLGVVALWIGTAFGAGLVKALGMYRALLFTAVLMMVTNLLFAWLALMGDVIWALAVAVLFEQLATGLGLVVFVAYLSGLCNLAFTASQYALLSSMAVFARSVMSAPSGFLVEAVGWPIFYVITTFAALPGLILLVFLWRNGIRVDNPALSMTGK